MRQANAQTHHGREVVVDRAEFVLQRLDDRVQFRAQFRREGRGQRLQGVAQLLAADAEAVQGRQVGPPLTTIGNKLSKEQFYEAILTPSASILMSFELWIVRTKDGDIKSGIKVEDTDDHITLKDWDEVMKVNVTANWQLICAMDALLRKSDAGRAVFITSGAAHNTRSYLGLYTTSKAALEALTRTYAAETENTAVRVNLFNPGPTRTRMRAQLMPGEDPMTLPAPEEVASSIVELCMPEFSDTGRFYDFLERRGGRWGR